MKFSIYIDKGKINLIDKKSFDSFIKNLDGQYILTLSKKQKKRSINQNALYWLWMSYLSEQTGYEKEWWHRYCANQFLVTSISISMNGKKNILFGVKSTTELSIAEMIEYMDKIQIHFLNFGYVLPSLEDLNFKNINLTNI